MNIIALVLSALRRVGLLESNVGDTSTLTTTAKIVVGSLNEINSAKAAKAATPTAGHISTLDENGNPVDGGIALSDVNSQLAKNANNLNDIDGTPLTIAWQIGYINGSTGAEGGTSPNVNLRTPLLLFRRGTTILNTHSKNLRVYEYTSAGVFVGEYAVVKNGATYLLATEKYTRMSWEYGTSTSDTSIPPLYITVAEKNAYHAVGGAMADGEYSRQRSDLAISQISSYFDTSKPTWTLGYISGTDGSLGQNSVTARTQDVLFFPKGSTLQVITSGATLSIMKYTSAGVWSAYLGDITYASGVYTFQCPMFIKLNYGFTGNPTITDINVVNTRLTIRRPSLAASPINAYWSGKKIVWFGTSIPAGHVTINGVSHTYPSLLGEMLNATVYNEAVGSSCVRAGSYADISVSDPLGYSGMFWNVLLLSLSLSSTEKQAIFDDWATWKTLLQGTVPDSISLEDQTMYKNTSWDIKLAKYLTGGSVGPVDLYVFDHGHNDSINYNWDDASEMGIVPGTTSGYTGLDSTDRTFFIGAMNYLIEKILKNNPKARILFIGHYENARKAGISLSQETLKEIWDYPLIKMWELLGWSQKSITSGGVTKTITQWWMTDDLHPHSDTTGAAIIKYADTLYPHIRDAR